MRAPQHPRVEGGADQTLSSRAPRVLELWSSAVFRVLQGGAPRGGGHSANIFRFRGECSSDQGKILSQGRKNKHCSDHEGTRTLNLLIRNQTPYPLGHAAPPIAFPQLLS